MCKYCGKQDKYFKEPAVIQNHIKNKCKSLTNCKYCNDLIEVKELKSHWLYHCKKGHFQNCSRCLEVFPRNEYIEHAEKFEMLGLCKKYGKNEVRCPFCEKDITMEGVSIDDCWTEHLNKKCMYNPRV